MFGVDTFRSRRVNCAAHYDFLITVAEVDESEEEGEELGGLFRVSRPQNSRKANGLDCSHFNPDIGQDQDLEEVQSSVAHFSGASRKLTSLTVCDVCPQMLDSIRDCFVTGKWEEGQDAATLLKEDGERKLKSSSFFFCHQYDPTD